MKKFFPALWLLFCPLPPFCAAQDFGVVINQNASLAGAADNADTARGLEYRPSLVPWFALPLGETADLYLSGAFGFPYEKGEWGPLPEIYRSEFIWSPRGNVRLEMGRFSFRDSLSWVMNGLFDGISMGGNIGGGRLDAGVFYTGLLSKKTASVFMTPRDRMDYADGDRYFASRRIVWGINWKKTGILDSGAGFAAGVAAQVDLNDLDNTGGGETRLDSQYLEGRFDLPLGNAFNAELGAVFELAETAGDSPVSAAFAGGLSLQWLPPTAIQDMASLGCRFSSGAWTGFWGAFNPISAGAQGKILRPRFSGVAIAEAAYSARLHRALSLELSAAYLFRTDKTTPVDPELDGSSPSFLLGAEAWGAFTWSPFRDITLNAGGGVFLPQTGNAFAEGTALRYRAELSAGISL